MELIRTSLKMYRMNRHKRSSRCGCHVESCHCSANEVLTCSAVQPVQRSSFDDLCLVYPCHDPSSCGDLPQTCAGDAVDHVASKIDRLSTADIIRIVLKPAVLDAIVTELEASFLSE